MAEQIPIGFALPQVSLELPVDVERVGRIARRAEALGFDSLWTLDQVLGGSRNLEPVSLLSYVAAITERVRLGTAVFVLPQRNPVQLAKELATLDVLSGGRLTVGLGIGNDESTNAAFGIPQGRRVRRFTESLAVMRALWSEREATLPGDLFALESTRMEPKPLQQPGPPVWFGGHVDAALRRAARLGDGWIGAGSSSIEDFREQSTLLRRHLEEADRDPTGVTISKRIYLAIDDDRDRAERRLRDWFGHVYGNPDLANRVATWGPAEACYERIDEAIAIGAQHLVLHPVFDFDEHLEALARYAKAPR